MPLSSSACGTAERIANDLDAGASPPFSAVFSLGRGLRSSRATPRADHESPIPAIVRRTALEGSHLDRPDRGEEPLVGEWPEQGYPQPTIGERVEQRVRGGGGKEESQGRPRAHPEPAVADRTYQSHQRRRHQGMAEAAVSELGRVGDAEAKGDDVQVGQNRGYDAGGQESAGDRPPSEPQPRGQGPGARGTAGWESKVAMVVWVHFWFVRP
jgi:hypothetical protein